jgi:hypothetical protein
LTAAATFRVLLAVTACAALLVMTALSDEIFFSDFPMYEAIESESPSGELIVIGEAHLYRIPSMTEVVLKVAVPLFALIGLAAFVSSRVAVRKVWAGTAASGFAALIAIAVQCVMAQNFGVSRIPPASTLAVWTATSLAIGAAASWAMTFWRPNKSLERTRER